MSTSASESTDSKSVMVSLLLPDGRRQTAKLVYGESHDGSEDNHFVQLDYESFREKEICDSDYFECLIVLRRALAEVGIKILVNGARCDTWPSGMSRSMAGGFIIYTMRLGHKCSLKDLVKIFAPAAPEQIVTPEEQSAYHDRWLESLGWRRGADGELSPETTRNGNLPPGLVAHVASKSHNTRR